VPGPYQEVGRQLHGSAGLSGVQRSGRRNRIRAGESAPGASFRGLWKEVEARFHGVPVPAGVYLRGGAIQQRAVYSLAPGAHRCCRAARQRGHLRHLPPVVGHRASDVHEPEQAGVSGDFFSDRLAAIRRCTECGRDGVPDQLGALPEDPLHAFVVRSGDLGGEGIPRAAVRGRDHELCLRAVVYDGEVRPPAREVHGVLLDVQRRCGAEGCERCRGHDQDEEDHPVRGLVPDGIQVRHQLPATDGRAGRRPCQGTEGGVHDLEQHERGGGVLAH